MSHPIFGVQAEVPEEPEEPEEEENEELTNNPYFISDRIISSLVLNIRKLMIPNPFDIKFRKSIFHKFFIASIQNVKKDCSRQVLISKLQRQLETGIYHFSFYDVDGLFKCLFYDLPYSKEFISNHELMNQLFLIMNIFMFRFYDLAFPFFYNQKIDDNIFTHDPVFIINYFLQFSYRFHQQSVASDSSYLNLLYEDGSFVTILNFLFDLYEKGDNLDILSDCIYKLMRWIDCLFLRDYLDKKHFFDKGSAIFINSSNKLIYRMDFQIAFFLNYFEFNFPKINDTFLRLEYTGANNYGEDFDVKEDFCQKSFDAIKEMQIFQYLYTYLSSFIDQLIIEGRLLNSQNPLSDNQSLGIDPQMEFYPNKAEYRDIYNILDLLISMFRYIDDFDFPSCILDFTPIITSLIKIIPGLFVSDWQKFPMLLFDYYKNTQNMVNYNLLKDSILEAIINRITGNYILADDNYLFSIFNSEKRPGSITTKKFKDLLDINRDSINHFIQILISNSNPICTNKEIIESIHLEQINDIQEWFYSLINELGDDKVKKDLILDSILEYGYASDDINFIDMILHVFKTSKFSEDQYKLLNSRGFMRHFIILLLNIPDLSGIEDLDLDIIVVFFQLFVSSKVPISNELINESYSIVIESCDMFKIKLFSILLSSGDEKRQKNYTDMIVSGIIDQVFDDSQGQINDQSIQKLISISPLLSTFNFQKSDEMLSLLRNSIDYINQYEEKEDDDFIIIDGNSTKNDEIMKFVGIDQFRVSLVLAITFSFGFVAQPEYANLIGYLLSKYGMCIEVLNVISKIIGNLINYIDMEGIADQLQATNDLLFTILGNLLENTPEIPEDQEFPIIYEKPAIPIDEEIKNKKSMTKLKIREEAKYMEKQFLKNKSCIVNFSLSPLNYEKQISRLKMSDICGQDAMILQNDDDDDDDDDNHSALSNADGEDDEMQILNNCYYSYKMEGEPNGAIEFSYIVNTGKYFAISHSSGYFEKVASSFVHNFANYSITLLKMLGHKNQPFNLIKPIILIALRNGLVDNDKLKDILNYIIDVKDFLADEEEINNWILACAQHTSVLMMSLARGKHRKYKDEDSQIPASISNNKKSQLRDLFEFFYKLNQIVPGCMEQEELVNKMLYYSSIKPDDFLDFINSDEEDMIMKLDLFFKKEPLLAETNANSSITPEDQSFNLDDNKFSINTGQRNPFKK